ncbi:hypothetical protein Hanom_Chr14g01252461 [Helianthus anomalus]
MTRLTVPRRGSLSKPCLSLYVPSLSLFRRFYQLQSDGDWFSFAKRKDRVSFPCYSFMPNSTYLKEWKNRFIFVSASMIPESLPSRDPMAVIDDGVPTFQRLKSLCGSRCTSIPPEP